MMDTILNYCLFLWVHYKALLLESSLVTIPVSISTIQPTTKPYKPNSKKPSKTLTNIQVILTFGKIWKLYSKS
ncbi:hypothetical protein AADEFJLK_00880 [Methylovulum psychrotolerans]|uniref:Uncharacterized protein n=1 Tax=Methylovulum psychrotolerans TaxID=1704499 RepID=A0A2S5CSM9_9GAMM|nr:hypothetical protein AADEFJLK_00880 [Methylovulum psychrotolerans]